jgi:hypothetical protein
MINKVLLLLLLFIITFLFLGDFYFSISISISSYFLIELIIGSNKSFAFREWTLFLYSVNYLFSPSITYQFDQSLLLYPMKIPARDYYPVVLAGFICFCLGIYTFKTRIFKPNITKISKDVLKNESLLINFVIFGIFFKLFGSIFPGELAFFVYLLSTIRFVGVFALFTASPLKYRSWLITVLLIEFYFAFIGASFHDAVMWILFFALYFVYTKKPSFSLRIIGIASCLIMVLFIQGVKGKYRSKIAETGKSDLGMVLETSKDVSDEVVSEDNLMGSLNRGNQAWIFASAKNRMDQVEDYQGFNILVIYLEAALLPRILAPNKIRSGDKKIFNTFSGHQINSNTSMGLGVFADGYIAFGFWGVMLFTFGLGLLFSISFRIIESWAKLSEFYVLMVLPILNYAIRPDCELQTTINHTVKGLLVFGILVTLTKFNFVINGSSSKSPLNRAALPDLNQINN